MKKLILLIILLSTTYLKSFSCTCNVIQDVGFALKSTDYVFFGEVIDFKRSTVYLTIDSFNTMNIDFLTYEFKIIKLYKGKVNTETILITTDNSNCGNSFEVGDKYVVYANYLINDYQVGRKFQYIYTSICNRTTNDFNAEMEAIYNSRGIRFRRFQPYKEE